MNRDPLPEMPERVPKRVADAARERAGIEIELDA